MRFLRLARPRPRRLRCPLGRNRHGARRGARAAARARDGVARALSVLLAGRPRLRRPLRPGRPGAHLGAARCGHDHADRREGAPFRVGEARGRPGGDGRGPRRHENGDVLPPLPAVGLSRLDGDRNRRARRMDDGDTVALARNGDGALRGHLRRERRPGLVVPDHPRPDRRDAAARDRRSPSHPSRRRRRTTRSTGWTGRASAPSSRPTATSTTTSCSGRRTATTSISSTTRSSTST